MKITKEAERMFLWLSPREFMELDSCVPAIKRYSLGTTGQEGLINLILDYPIGNLVAVLDGNHSDGER